MKLLGKVTETLLSEVFEESTYKVVRVLAKSFDIPDFSEEEKVVNVPKEKLLAMMVSQVMGYDKVKMVIGYIGVEEFCEHWSEYVSKINQDIRVKASGEFDVLNMKINYVINRFIKQK